MKNRFLTTDLARLFGIGGYYVELTTHVVGGTRLGHAHAIDLEHADLDSMIEVKGCGSSEAPKVYSEQVERHSEQRGFPYKHCLYGIWSYFNSRYDRIGEYSLGTTDQLCEQLAKRTRALYLLDVRILLAVESKLGTEADRRFNTEASRIRINTTWLRSLAEAPQKTLARLGLRPRSFYVQQATVRTLFLGRLHRFEYTAVLPLTAAGYVWPVHRTRRRQLAAISAASA